MLLMLTEKDLREKPLEMTCLGDIKRLAIAISMLRDSAHPKVLVFLEMLTSIRNSYPNFAS